MTESMSEMTDEVSVFSLWKKFERTVRMERPRCFWNLEGEEEAEDGGGV